MTDRIPGAPGRYSGSLPDGELEKLQRGEPFAITLTRDDAPIVEGTPYSKAAVLPDELAEKICPGVADPAPKDALAALHLIADQGASGGWTYRKWENGNAECWRFVTLDFVDSRLLARWVQLPFSMSGMAVSMTIINATSDYLTHTPMVLTYDTITSSDNLQFAIIRDAGGFESTDYVQICVHIVGAWE